MIITIRKLKKLLLCSLFILIINVCSISSKAAEIIDQGTCGTNLTWEYTSENVLIIKGTGSMSDYSDMSVPPWYKFRNKVEKIVIGEGVTSIGSWAFSHMQEREVVFPSESLESIEGCAFEYNEKLKEIILPDSISHMGGTCFWICQSVEKVYIPGTLKRVGDGCFANVGSGAFVEIGNGITCISDAFSYANIRKMIIPETVTTIDENDLCVGVAYSPSSYVRDKLDELGNYCVDTSKDYSISNADISISGLSYHYTGEEITPDVSVNYQFSDGFTTNLVKNEDYSVTYSNNKEIGKGQVIITGKGFYSGTITKEFEIYEDIPGCNISIGYDSVLYDGKEKQPSVTVKNNDKILTEGTDYTTNYSNNIEEGQATVTITGKGSFKGEINQEFSIYKYDLTKTDISQSFTEVLYDGSAKSPDITVKYEGKKLVKDTDYSIEVSNNINPGIVTLKIVGLNQYSGIIEKQFEIKGLSIENADVLLKESIYSYDGSPKTPPVEVKLGDKTLVKDTDYTVTYENNINDGTAHAVVTGIGIFTDVVKASFIILPYNAGMDSVYPEGTMIDGDFAYGVTDDEKNEVELFCPASQNVKNIQIPATITDENGTVYTVTSIGNKAFYKNTKITGVTIANPVKSIEDYAFYGCKNIKTIKIGSGVELIGNSAFRKCTKLTSITLPKSLDQIGKNVFYGCSKLKTITINAKSVVDIKANAIKGISKKAVIKVPSKLVKKYKKEFDKKSGFNGGMKVKKK